MNHFFSTIISRSKSNYGLPRYNEANGQIVTFNVGGQKFFSFSRITLSKYKDSLLFKFAFLMPVKGLVLDSDKFIYLDISPETFQLIHDYMKGYSLDFKNMTLNIKERLLQDAITLQLPELVKLVEKQMPDLSPENVNYWADLISQQVVLLGKNLESIYYETTGENMDYRLVKKLDALVNKDEKTQQKISECVKQIIEKRKQEADSIDSVLLHFMNEIATDLQSNYGNILTYIVTKFF